MRKALEETRAEIPDLTTLASSLCLIAGLALVLRMPLIFPSLGPSALLMFYAKDAPEQPLRSVFWSHCIGLACGYAALVLMGAAEIPVASLGLLDWKRIATVGIAIVATGALMRRFSVFHAPAGSSTLMVALGLTPHFDAIAKMLGGVACLVAYAALLKRWRARQQTLR